MRDNFNRVYDHLILNESGHKNFRAKTSEGIWGFVNNPLDRGGPTIHGVTWKYWKIFINKYKEHDFFLSEAWSKFHSFDDHGRPFFDPDNFKMKDFKFLNPSDLKFYYHREYWEGVNGDELPSGIDYYMLDFCVHSGAGNASRPLQRIVGVFDDGKIGDQTIAAVFSYVEKNGIRRLIKEVDRARRDFLSQLKSSPHFLKGWNNRLERVLDKCYELIGDVYVNIQKPVRESRTVSTSKKQIAFAGSAAAVGSVVPDEKSTKIILDNLEVAETVTSAVSGIYSYGYRVIFLVIIGFALYQIYTRYEDWFKGNR